MSLRLLDADALAAAPGPMARFLAAVARNGSQAYIANLRTRVLGLELTPGTILPLTVNHGEYGDAFTALPHSAYALYAKDELARLALGPARPLLNFAADAAGAMLRAGRINRIVQLDNLMASTNLHAAFPANAVAPGRALLVERFPAHFLGVRSLNQWSDTPLIAALVEDGWRLVPSRLIFVMDDPRTERLARRNGRRDIDLLARADEPMRDLDTLGPGDAERIASLYRSLYNVKYSRFNPAFTAAFVALSHATGLLRFRATRDRHGLVSAVVATAEDAHTLCLQIVAYDQRRPQADALYRKAMAAGVEMAIEAGLKLNWSAGVDNYKRTRGARAVVEYNAFYDRHLSAPRRLALAALDVGVRRLAARFVAPVAG